MVKCDDFVYIFHGERFVKRGAPVDKTLVLEQPLGNKFFEIVVGTLTVSPFSRQRLRLLFLLILLVRSLGRSGAAERRRDLVGLGLSKEVKAECGSIWGIWKVLGGLQIGSTVFTWLPRG
jgi:hypothetical protein